MDKELTIRYREYASMDELSVADQELVQAAVEAAGGAYAPYSGFRVGAAVRLDEGSIVRGSNQENVAYPSGLCAERTALFAASAQYPHSSGFEVLAIVGRNGLEELCAASPCGACRQVMNEYERRQGHPLRILCLLENGRVREIRSAADMLPLAFEM